MYSNTTFSSHTGDHIMMFIFFALLVSHLVLTYYIASDLYIIAKQLSKKEETENDDS